MEAALEAGLKELPAIAQRYGFRILDEFRLRVGLGLIVADDKELHLLDEEERREQLLAAPNAVESDAAPRIELLQTTAAPALDIAETGSCDPAPSTTRRRR